MNVDNVFEYFYERKGNKLAIDKGKEVKLITVRKGDVLSDEMILVFKYRNNEISVYISRVQEEYFTLEFNKTVKDRPNKIQTPLKSLDATLLIYLGKFVEEADEKVEFKLFDWRG